MVLGPVVVLDAGQYRLFDIAIDDEAVLAVNIFWVAEEINIERGPSPSPQNESVHLGR